MPDKGGHAGTARRLCCGTGRCMPACLPDDMISFACLPDDKRGHPALLGPACRPLRRWGRRTVPARGAECNPRFSLRACRLPDNKGGHRCMQQGGTGACVPSVQIPAVVQITSSWTVTRRLCCGTVRPAGSGITLGRPFPECMQVAPVHGARCLTISNHVDLSDGGAGVHSPPAGLSVALRPSYDLTERGRRGFAPETDLTRRLT